LKTIKKTNIKPHKYINYNELRSALNKTNWNNIKKINLAEDKIMSLSTIIQNHINKCTHYGKTKHKQDKQWITPGIIKSIKIRNKLHTLTRRQPFNLLLINKYKTYRNKLTDIIFKQKQHFYGLKIKSCSNNPKKIWSTIKEITTQTQSHQQNYSLNIHSNIHESNEEPLLIANTFNEHFLTMGNHNNTFKNHNINNSLPINSNPKQSFYLRKISASEICNIIDGMRNDSAPGKDGISINVIKQNKETLSNILEHIFNKIIQESNIPNTFKCAIVTPIHKGGDKTSINNYRPISLLNIFSKIFERAIKTRLLSYLEENDILPKSQFGFRERLGTEDALTELSMDIYSNLNKKNKTLGIFLDLSKAFDSISHQTLINTLKSIGIVSIPLLLLKSYLTNRIQQVRISNTLSKEIIITTGVPQGTVLSPILYLIYVTSLAKLNLHGKLFSYADDTAILLTGNNWEEIRQNAESDMHLINTWFLKNNLRINYTKSNFLTFTHDKRTQPNFNEIKIHDSNCKTNNCSCNIINKTDHTKYLGLIIDQHLKWDIHINTLIIKLRKLQHLYINARKFLNIQTLRMIYFSLTQSILHYGITAWGGLGIVASNKILRAQKSIIKIILKKPKTHPTTQIYKEFNVLSVQKLFQRNSLYFIYKMKLINLKHKYYNTRLENNIEIHTTR
jgi:hypothetical protein